MSKNQIDIFGKCDNGLPEDIMDLYKGKSVINKDKQKKYYEKRRNSRRKKGKFGFKVYY